MKIMVINSGSSSIKYRLFDMSTKTVLASGIVEQIGETRSQLSHQTRTADGGMDGIVKTVAVADHRAGFELIGTAMEESGALKDAKELSGIGHRVVHGGEEFKKPTRINQKVIDTIRRLSPLAPLHNPSNLLGIEVARQSAPDVPQVAVFDTAFHQSLPERAYRYAIPQDLYEAHQVRRYGFHGTSHHYVSKQAARQLGKALSSLNLITLHLGNGASAAAIRRGESVDTSMGMTPLEGLMMGTRCGDIDPAIHFYLCREAGVGIEALESLLNKDSGLKGICGANDMREVQRLADAGDDRARLALTMYGYRIKKYIGAYYAVLGHVDAVVFTGGIGENDARVRAQACTGLDALGIELDSDRNSNQDGGVFAIHGDGSPVSILVVPTDEELEIALQTVDCVAAAGC